MLPAMNWATRAGHHPSTTTADASQAAAPDEAFGDVHRAALVAVRRLRDEVERRAERAAGELIQLQTSLSAPAEPGSAEKVRLRALQTSLERQVRRLREAKAALNLVAALGADGLGHAVHVNEAISLLDAEPRQ